MRRWRDLYDALPAERRARIEQAVADDLSTMEEIMLIPTSGYKRFAGRHDLPGWMLANVTCPECGKDMSINGHVHQIDDDGVMTPSLVCPFPPCNFHKHAALEGWSAAPATATA